ncbi:50S ribosomal protein L18e [uncultured archaeon]|nr:50S ribosomal protein L18e [uncultured archaeon]
MSLKANRKSNPLLKDVINGLIEVSRESGSLIWRDIAKRLNGGDRRYASVNVSKISRLSSDGDLVVIPGSLLGSGYIDKKVTVSALRISDKAKKKLDEAGGSYKPLLELAKENPKGTNVRIMR